MGSMLSRMEVTHWQMSVLTTYSASIVVVSGGRREDLSASVLTRGGHAAHAGPLPDLLQRHNKEVRMLATQAGRVIIPFQRKF